MKPSLNFYTSLLDRGDFAEVYLEDSKNLSIRWEDGGVESIGRSSETGVGLRYLQGLESRFGHVTLSNGWDLPPAPAEQSSLIRIREEISTGLPKINPRLLEGVPLSNHPMEISFSSKSLDEKIGFLKKVEEASTGPNVRQIAINYGEKLKDIICFNSIGEAFHEVRPYGVLSITVTVERNGDRQTAYEAVGGIGGWEKIEREALSVATMVRERAFLKLDAPEAPAGERPVVIASSAGGTLIHEAIGHSLEADAVLEGTSPAYRGKVGQVVGVPFLNVYDDPTVPGARGSFYFDDEGTPSEKTCLVENGVLKTYLYDRVSARRAGVSSNGHGRRESFRHRPIPRMSNTYVAPGKDNPDSILQGFQEGFLVTKMGGGQVNTANGDFVFEVEEGFRVDNGKKTMVRGATLLGNGPDVLFQIESIGTDHGWGLGTCGKEGQGVPVGDAIPTMKFKKLVVGGAGN